MKKAIFNFTVRSKKNKAILTIGGIIFLIGITIFCTSLFWMQRIASSASQTTDISTNVQLEHVLQYNSSGNSEGGNEYTVSSEQYGMICTGYNFSTRTEAYANPVIVQAPSVIVSISGGWYTDSRGGSRKAEKTREISANSSVLVFDNHNESLGYLYVIVKPVAQEQDFTQDSTYISECVECYSSAPLNEAYGMYTVSNSDKGSICMGNAYSSASLAYANPLIINESTVKVTVSDLFGENSNSEAVSVFKSATQLISSSSFGGQVGYIYIILRNPT